MPRLPAFITTVVIHEGYWIKRSLMYPRMISLGQVFDSPLVPFPGSLFQNNAYVDQW